MKKHRLIIDASSIVRAAHYAGEDLDNGYKVTFEDKKVHINPASWCYDNFILSYRNLLDLTGTAPMDTVLVLDGKNSRSLRQSIYPEYKAHRKPGPPELNKEFYDALDGIADEIKSLGGTVMVQDGMEADDVIAYLSTQLRGKKTIWSRDGDMLALRSAECDVYLKDQMNPEIYASAPAQYVLLYKALVGDTSDGLPGAKGFGPKAFTDMVFKFGYEGCDEFLNLLEQRRLGELAEDVADFKPLQKVLDNQETVYASYLCAKFYPQRVNTSREPLTIETGICQQWDSEIRHPRLREFFGTKTLITADNFAASFAQLQSSMKASPFVTLDLEAADTDEGAAWAKRIYDSKKGNKSPVVDVFGQRITGVSITYGSNLQHTFYCSVDHANTANCTLEQAKALIDSIPADRICAVQNASYELPVLNQHYDGYWLPNVWDTQDMASYVDENLRSGLKPSSKHYLGYEQTTYEQVTAKEGPVGTLEGGEFKEFFRKEVSPETTDSQAVYEEWERRTYRMSQLTAAEVFDYGCDDTICTAALFNRYLITMELEQTLDAFLECELDSNYWVAEAFVEGINVDIDRLKELELEDDATYEKTWAELREFLFSVNWPGCYFEPVEEITPAVIKEVYSKICGGLKLECMARKLEKIADALEVSGAPGLAPFVRDNDVDGLNAYLESIFDASPEFDINKDDHIRKLMYDELELPVRFRTRVTDLQRKAGKREGTPQADFSAMEHALELDTDDKPEVKRILNLVRTMNQINTRRQLYYKPFPLYVHWKDGKIHASLGKNRTATRRFAPNNPNFNQLAKKGEGKKIRTTLRAPEGFFVAAKDFNGQELRLAAEESQDEMLLSCYIGEDLKDPHSLTGASIAEKKGSVYGDYAVFETTKKGADEEAKKVVDDFRDLAKKVNFGSQYLCRAPKLAKLMVVSVEEAQLALDAKNGVYSGLAQWQQDTIAEAHAQGYVTTRLGARRHLHHKLSSADKWEVMEAERQAVNFKIQASGAEMTKRAINSMRSILKKYGAKFWMPVHDETVTLIPIKHAVACLQELHACMVQPYGNMTVPLLSEISIGLSFGELVKVGTKPTAEAIEAALTKIFPTEIAA